MRRRPLFARRTRLRIALLALCALLFQQLALVAYACSLPQAAVPVQAAMQSMASMPCCDGMTSMIHHARALCVQHCAQPAPAPQDARAPMVSALALPPQPPVLAITPAPPSTRLDERAAADLGASPPPRCCVLLI